ncbi:MAG TPA: hypothetical protein VK147_12955, partial [Candidatus Didemnitutus sp.]|nr:hypothetical protein [Candidatus Didemnitutus sp.]
MMFGIGLYALGTMGLASPPAAPSSGISSIGLTMPAIFSVSPATLVSNGTFAVTLASQAANLVMASPDGSAGAPSFRSLVAPDIPNLDAAKITTGQLSVARGGTGLDASAASNGQVLIGNGSGFSLATITAGSGVSITNGSGTITIT